VTVSATDEPRERAIGTALGVVSALGFASGPIFAILLYRLGFEWAPILAWRFVIAAVVAWSVALLVPAYRRDLRELGRKQFAALIALGFLFVGAATTYYAAIVYVPASVAVLVVNLSPALIAVISLRLGLGLQGWTPWLALVIATLGATLAVIGPEIPLNVLGIGLAAASAVLYAIWAMFSARSAGERRGRRVDGTSSGAAVAIMFSATALALMVLVVIRGESLSLAGMSPLGWVYLSGFAVIGSILGIQASYAAAARIGASRTGILLTTEPIFTVALAAAVLGEELTPLQLLGGVLVVVGIMLLRVDLRGLRTRLTA
jgi:drug/metabolite transporter (DMT)-like permease